MGFSITKKQTQAKIPWNFFQFISFQTELTGNCSESQMLRKHS